MVLCADGAVPARSDGAHSTGALDDIPTRHCILVQVDVLAKDLQLFHAPLEPGMRHGDLWVDVGRHQAKVDSGRLSRHHLDLLLATHGVRLVDVDDGGALECIRVHGKLHLQALGVSSVHPVAGVRKQDDLGATAYFELEGTTLNITCKNKISIFFCLVLHLPCLHQTCNHNLVFVSSVEYEPVRSRGPKGQHEVESGSVVVQLVDQ